MLSKPVSRTAFQSTANHKYKERKLLVAPILLVFLIETLLPFSTPLCQILDFFRVAPICVSSFISNPAIYNSLSPIGLLGAYCTVRPPCLPVRACRFDVSYASGYRLSVHFFVLLARL